MQKVEPLNFKLHAFYNLTVFRAYIILCGRWADNSIDDVRTTGQEEKAMLGAGEGLQ